MPKKAHGLGRGLDALLPEDESQDLTGVQMIDIGRIDPNLDQPRKAFSQESISLLAQSISTQGILQPILVVKGNKDRFTIVAGERRWRAAREAGLTEVPCLIREMLMEADYFERPVADIRTLGYFINTLIIFLGFLALSRSLLRFFTKRDEADFISTVLSLGFFIVSLLYILTDAGIDMHSSRYFAWGFCGFSVLIIRNREDMGALFGVDKRRFSLAVLLLSLVSFAFRIVPAFTTPIPDMKERRLEAFLESNGLEAGYASFWNASSTTVLSKNRVRVRAVTAGQGNPYNLQQYKWFCKNEWYGEKSSFVVAAEDDSFGITPECVVGSLGEADRMLYFEDFTILIYERDISQDLVNGISDGILKAAELYSNEYADPTSDRKYILRPGAVLYGPYDAIESGEYILTYFGENLRLLTVDVYSNTGGFLELKQLSAADDRLEYAVTVPLSLPDIELREYNQTQEPIVFDRITIRNLE